MTSSRTCRSRDPWAMTEPLDRRYDAEKPDAIDVAALETFPYEYPGKDITVLIDTDEFTAVCPWSGLPDFGTIHVEYIPARVLIELRSFKYYLLSYRNVGIYQEHAVNRILEDLVRWAKPKWMKVTADYKIRGGVHTVASRVYRGKRRGSQAPRPRRAVTRRDTGADRRTTASLRLSCSRCASANLPRSNARR